MRNMTPKIIKKTEGEEISTKSSVFRKSRKINREAVEKRKKHKAQNFLCCGSRFS